MEKTLKKYNLLQTLIIPASKLENHPLGAKLLNDTLLEIKNVFERDLKWSGPDRHEARTTHYIRLNLLEENPIQNNDKCTGLPLVYVWFLASVDNKFRNLCKIELTKWGINNVSEFVKLLNLTWETNDPQMKEDLSCIMLGITSAIKPSNDNFKELVEWVKKEIFTESKIIQNKNVLVRHSARCVMEKAYMFNLISFGEVDNARPPYNIEFQFVTLNEDALKNKGEEFYPIVHDLAWYVIKKSYEGFLDYSRFEKKTDDNQIFLKAYSAKFNLEISAYSFAMAYAIEYINSLGLNNQVNGQNTTTEGTHGTKSKFATYEEKYTWCAVHEILGYLSDHLPYGKYKERKKVKDYNELISIPNPAQWISNSFFNLVSPKPSWLFNQSFLPSLSYNMADYKAKIDAWISNEVKIDPSFWLNPAPNLIELCFTSSGSKWLVLSSQINHTDSNEKGYWALEFNSFLTSEQQMPAIIKEPQNYFSELDHLKFRPKTKSYISPKDVIWMDWVEEEEGIMETFIDENTNSTIESTKTVIMNRSIDNGEEEYIIPSKHVRNLTSISEGNGNVCFNENGQIISFSNVIENDHYNQEETLLIDQDLFYEKIKVINKSIFWIGKLFRRNATSEKTEDLKYYNHNTEQWIIWLENEEYKIKKFDEL